MFKNRRHSPQGEVFMAQASDVDWWTGSHDDGRTGIFPSSYVKKLETVVRSDWLMIADLFLGLYCVDNTNV